MADKRPPASLPPVQKGFGPTPTPALPPRQKKKGFVPNDHKAYAKAYAAGVLQRMSDKLHPQHLRKKKG